jgi:hypothetical protein
MLAVLSPSVTQTRDLKVRCPSAQGRGLRVDDRLSAGEIEPHVGILGGSARSARELEYIVRTALARGRNATLSLLCRWKRQKLR